MKICFVTDTFYPDTNGVAVALKNYADGLIKSGHEVVIIRGRGGKEKKNEIKESNYNQVVIYSVPVPTYEQLRLGIPINPKLALVMEKEKFDVVYLANEWISGVFIANMARIKGIPVVSAYHTNISQYVYHYGIGLTKKIVDVYMSWFHNQANTVIVHSPASKEYLESIKVKRPIYTLFYGVDTDLFTPQKRDNSLRKKWGVDDSIPVLLYVGRISPEKNLQLFFKVVDELKSKKVPFKAVIVGEGPLGKELKEKYDEIIFTGPLFEEDLASAFASSDIFLFPSMTDTFGMVSTEALSSGLFVIGFDAGAIREYIIEGKTGHKIPLEDEDLFIKKTFDFVSTWKEGNFDREEASKSVEETAWVNVVSKLENIFRTTIRLSEDKSIFHKEIDFSFFKKSLKFKLLSRFFDRYI